MARPSTYTEEMASEICRRVAAKESVRSICREDGMPGLSTVFQWLGAHPEFAEQYTRAREAQAEAIFDEMLDIADESGLDVVMGEDGPKVQGEVVNRARLRIDTRKWVLGRMAPKKYGDRVDVDMRVRATSVDTSRVLALMSPTAIAELESAVRQATEATEPEDGNFEEVGDTGSA